MKKLFFCVVFTMGAIGFVQAQSAGAQGSKNTTQSSSTGKAKKGSKATNQSSGTDSLANNRVEYKSKKTRQTATQSGQEATGTNGSHANTPKNAGKNDE
jgi:hypothetical protein